MVSLDHLEVHERLGEVFRDQERRLAEELEVDSLTKEVRGDTMNLGYGLQRISS